MKVALAASDHCFDMATTSIAKARRNRVRINGMARTIHAIIVFPVSHRY